MSTGSSYGELLRSAREREGLDMATMSRRLHIRPDILRAIEAEDFERMPARGYSKNMIRAYARQLGLDDRKITSMYLQSLDAYEGHVPHERSARPDSSTRRESAHPRRTKGRAPSQQRSSRANSQQLRPAGGSRRTKKRTNAPSGFLNDRSSRPLSQSFSTGSFSTSFSGAPARRGSIFANMNLMALIAIAVVVVIVIALVVVFFNGSKQSADQVPDIPISGLTDTSSPDDATEPTPVAVAPSSAIFSFSVEEGQSSWIEVYENGSSTPLIAEAITGPYSKDFDVTTTLRFRTANPTPVTIAVDGKEEKLQKEADSYYYVYTVDFPAILAAWRAEHEQDANTTSSSQSTVSGTASSSSSSSSASSTS